MNERHITQINEVSCCIKMFSFELIQTKDQWTIIIMTLFCLLQVTIHRTQIIVTKRNIKILRSEPSLFRAFSDEWPNGNNETLLPVVGHQGYGTQYPDKWTLQLCVTCIMPLLTTDNELLPFNFLPHECGLIRIYLLFQVSIAVSFFSFSRQTQSQFTTERDWNQFHQLRNPVLAMVWELAN